MKKVLTEPPEVRKEAEAERRKTLNHTFRTATFSELTRRTQPKVNLNVIVFFFLFNKYFFYCSMISYKTNSMRYLNLLTKTEVLQTRRNRQYQLMNRISQSYFTIEQLSYIKFSVRKFQ